VDTGKLEGILKGKIEKLEFFDELESTNGYAKINNSGDNTLVLCDHQTGGKGRFSRKWEAVKGEDLTFTLVRSFKLAIDDMQLVNFYTTYVIFCVIKEMLKEKADGLKLKWPNDILLNGKKISGILIEVKDINKAEKRFIIGVGINVNQGEMPDGIKDKASSLFIESGGMPDREELLSGIVSAFYEREELIKDKEKLFDLWKENCEHMGKEIKIRKYVDDEEIPALVKGLSTDGGLLLEMKDGSTSTFYSGEISVSYNK
jgi:BirA family biotin operon repressor/biotin-[acetyl-CoA-carboxylase] ligase